MGSVERFKSGAAAVRAAARRGDKGRGKWYLGKTARVHDDGLCDFDYDDGEKETRVDKDLIRVPLPGEATGGRPRLQNNWPTPKVND